MLTRCYDNVLTKGCGPLASDAIMGLIVEAFKDPYYLRFKYKPNCALHGITTTTVPTTTSTRYWVTTPSPYPKSLKERSDDARAFNDARSTNGNIKQTIRIPVKVKSSGSHVVPAIPDTGLLLLVICLSRS